ncbi:olfactory receptor 6N1-like [Rhinatrema bivittatum]|uniref:olfactory receptor 6N1-like n=1 Tax=Rhinatrema bivittatum TaxID=194408 RepID=UPI001126FC58|nr:olfactory receptor 6N1-like [Rhinatrema bivittatum]
MGKNQTFVTEFIIIGFSTLPRQQHLLFVVSLLIYILTITGNIVIIVLIVIDRSLHTPMYFFLSIFSFSEITYVTVIEPNMIAAFLVEKQTISYSHCMAQLYFFVALLSTESFLLAVMAYDRYMAICNPLHYTTIMNECFCIRLALSTWMLGFFVPVIPLILISKLHFCGPNTINHFYCDYSLLLNLSCTDITVIKVYGLIFAPLIILASFLSALMSYAYIISTILRIPSATGRRKAFSTCASHLIVVIVFFGSGILIYATPSPNYALDFNKTVSVFYTVGVPLLNPFIYSLRNKEVKDALCKLLKENSSLDMKAWNLK